MRCAVPWGNVFGPAQRAYRPILLEADGCRHARRGMRDLGTCASEGSGLQPQRCRPVEGLCP